MITIVDYGLGNLNSIKSMLRRIGFSSQISSDPEVIDSAEKLILPGVGAFDNGMRNIAESGLRDVLDKKALYDKIPILGICLGMQLLAESSAEGVLPGLGWIKGHAKRFDFPQQAGALKVPHMGWNTVKIMNSSPLTLDFLEEMRFYFVHSYHVFCENPQDICLQTQYGVNVTAAVAHGNIMGTQFHPEKSHKFGMIILKNFAEYKPC